MIKPNIIESLCTELKLPPEEVNETYIEMVKNGLSRGRPHAMLLGASMYVVARKHGLPITIADIAKLLNVDKEKLRKSTKAVVNSMNVKITPPSVETFIKSLAEKLGLPDDVSNDAVKLATKVNFGGKKEVLAAAALYLVAKERGIQITEKLLADYAHVSEMSIRMAKKRFVKTNEKEIISTA